MQVSELVLENQRLQQDIKHFNSAKETWHHDGGEMTLFNT